MMVVMFVIGVAPSLALKMMVNGGHEAWSVMLVTSRLLSITTRHAGIDIPEDKRARVFVSVV
jgi:hypothetical protein